MREQKNNVTHVMTPTRYRLRIEYDGTYLIGWQKQSAVRGVSVQASIETAISQFLKESITLTCAGRTDAGVHALGQVAHFTTSAPIPMKPDTMTAAINFHLRPRSIIVLQTDVVPLDWDARLSAKKKFYCYRILNRIPRPTLQQQRVWHVRHPINIERVRQAARYLEGLHNFNSFRTKYCQAQNPVRTIDQILVTKEQEILSLRFVGPSFLHKQVRIMTGTLLEFGRRPFLEPSHMQTILDAKDRRFAYQTAPAHGLYLERVEY